jgi:hypothetical protein
MLTTTADRKAYTVLTTCPNALLDLAIYIEVKCKNMPKTKNVWGPHIPMHRMHKIMHRQTLIAATRCHS